VQAVYQGQASDPFPIDVAAATPALFTADGSGGGEGLIVNEDGSANSADSPAASGSTVFVYATGAGLLSPAVGDGQITADTTSQPVLPISVLIDGQPAEVLYAGSAPGQVAGILQINVRLPQGVSASELPILLRVGNAASQPGVMLAVQ
jgi:uncharacterized protein (TIGR03437 family)